MKVTILLASMLFLVGCSAKPEYLKLHSQGELPKADVALVKPLAYILVNEIDGVKTTINPSGPGLLITEYELEFIPGPHSIKVTYNDGVFVNYVDIELRATLEAGKKYIINPMTPKKFWWSRSGEPWKPTLIDVTNRPECWTLKAETTSSIKDCR